MALLTRKRLILIKKESTYGTDVSPAGTDAVLVRDLSVTPLQSDVVSRDLVRSYLGASEQLLANTRVECQFTVELAGSGTAGTAPRYGSALQACGLSETIVASTSVTYAPVSASFSSVTIYYNVDGVLHKVTGARGTFTLNAEVGQIPTIQFTMTGIYNAPTDTAAPAVTYSSQATPLIFKEGNTSAFEFFSYAGCLQSVTFDVGNTTVYRELVGCTKETLITQRASTGTVMIEAPTIATKDYFSAALADGTTGNLTFLHGTTAGNRATLTVPRADLGDPSYGDQDGIAMLNLPYTAIPSTSGNDEVSLAFT
ncbi:MAG: phage tail tube protein [Candidatus Limnocylindrus sp.]